VSADADSSRMPDVAPHPLFAEPFLGSLAEPENGGDEYIPLLLRWPRPLAEPLYINLRGGPQSIAELRFDLPTRLLTDVTLVLAPADAWSIHHADSRIEIPVEEGLPRCDARAWIARTETGSLDDFRHHYHRVDCRVRAELRPSELVVRFDGLAGAAARELASGRVRIGVDARGAMAYVRLTRLTAREAALLAEHAPTDSADAR
jgi:hypothetical protein